MRLPSGDHSTEKRVLYSTVAAYGSQFGRTVLRLITDITLARLILPDDHGLFALGWATVVLMGFVRDLGLPYELVRHSKQPYGSFLIWEASSGLLVTGGVILAAPLFGGLSPGLPEVLRILAFYILIEAFAVVPRVFFERQLAVTRLVGPEIGRGAILAVTSIGLASLGAGVWSFVFGELLAALFYVVILWRRALGWMPLEFDLAMVPRLLRHSIILFVIALIGNSTPLIGRYLVEFVDTTAMVGQFEKAFLWALRTQILFVPALVRVLYPALVTYREDRERFVTAFRLGTVGILSLEVMVAYFIFFNAEVVVLKILLGENWEPAVHLIRILCFLPLVDPFNRLGGELLKVRREDRAWLAIAIVNVVTLVGFGLLLSHYLGASGVAWAHYLMLGHLLMAWRVHRICGPDFWRLLRELAFVYALPLPFYAVVAWLLPAASWWRFTGSMAVSAVVGLILLWRFHRPFREFFAERLPEELPDEIPPLVEDE